MSVGSFFRKPKGKRRYMNSKTRLITMASLLISSVLGGLIGEYLDAEMGFFIGIMGTYVLLSVLLIFAGKIRFTRNG